MVRRFRGDAPPDDRPLLDREAICGCFPSPEVVSVHLFGSRATGSGGPLSDIDLAYLGADARVEDEVFDGVYESLQRLLGEGNFDLVPLRRAPLPLRFQIVTGGEELASRDPVLLERFAACALSRYLDFKYYRDAYFASGA